MPPSAWTGADRPLASRGARILVFAAGSLCYAWLWYWNAWLTDDPFITFRTVEQLFAGHGLRFNLHERVQAFTHPLWLSLLLIPRLLGASPPLAAHLISLAAMIGTLLVLAALAQWRPWRSATALALMLGSRTLADFSSSGFETPATILGVVGFWLAARRCQSSPESSARFVGLGLVVSALLLNRHDLALLVVPAYVYFARQRVRRARGPAALEAAVGLLPFALWSLFATIYYGSPFPNTAAAKLGAGVPATELIAAGARYLRLHFAWDPLLVPLLVAAVALGVRRRGACLWFAVGISLQTVYVVAVGGDWMAGRFCLPATAAALALVVAEARTTVLAGALLPLATAAAILVPGAPLRVRADYAQRWLPAAQGRAGVFDEKGDPALRSWLHDELRSQADLVATLPLGPPRAIHVLGRESYRSSLEQILVDRFALSDPLLARLPAQPPWSTGHLERPLPDGYLESLATGEERIADPSVARLYRDVRLVTSGPLFAAERWRALVRLQSRQPIAPRRARCPLVGLRDIAAAGERRAVAVESLRVEGPQIHARGALPVGRRPHSWRLEVVSAPAPLDLELHCLDRPHQVPLDYSLELRFASEPEAVRAARSLALALVESP